MVHAGIGHLREHQVRRSNHLLHPDRHVLGVILLAIDGELQPAVTADAKIHRAQAGPPHVLRIEKRLGIGCSAITGPINRCHRVGQHPLQVLLVNVSRRMAAWTDPMLEDVGVAVDDHSELAEGSGFVGRK